jgi:hypothetical protein
LLIFDVSLGIFISGSCAAHENRDEFVAFGNLRCHGAVRYQSKIKIQQSSIRRRWWKNSEIAKFGNSDLRDTSSIDGSIFPFRFHFQLFHARPNSGWRILRQTVRGASCSPPRRQ